MSLLSIKIKRSLENAYERCNEKSYNIFDHSCIIANEMYESDVKEHSEEMKRINKIVSSSSGTRVNLWNFTSKNLGKLDELYVPLDLVENLVTESRHNFIKNKVKNCFNESKDILSHNNFKESNKKKKR